MHFFHNYNYYKCIVVAVVNFYNCSHNQKVTFAVNLVAITTTLHTFTSNITPSPFILFFNFSNCFFLFQTLATYPLPPTKKNHILLLSTLEKYVVSPTISPTMNQSDLNCATPVQIFPIQPESNISFFGVSCDNMLKGVIVLCAYQLIIAISSDIQP